MHTIIVPSIFWLTANHLFCQTTARPAAPNTASGLQQAGRQSAIVFDNGSTTILTERGKSFHHRTEHPRDVSRRDGVEQFECLVFW